jgi:hypothetical protein
MLAKLVLFAEPLKSTSNVCETTVPSMGTLFDKKLAFKEKNI